MDEDKIKNMKCKELQHELKLIKKPIYGVKAVLVESNNNVIKTHHSLRRRLSLGHYLGNAVNMMHSWSVDRTKHKIFQNELKISLDDWKLT